MKKLLVIAAMALAAGTATAQTNEKGGHRGVDFGVNTGYSFYTKGGSGEIPVELSLGKRFNKSFYWGVSSGVVIPTSEDAEVHIPITTDFKLLFPLSSPTLTPGISLRAGYVINTKSEKEVKIDNRHTEYIEMPNHIMVEAMPTVYVALSPSIDLVLGLGYTHYVPTKGGDGFGAVSLKTALNFHKSTVEREAKEKVPTRDRGVEIGGDVASKFGFNEPAGLMGELAFMYKWNPNISFGVGGGYEYVVPSADGVDPIMSATKFFARGEYRLNDNKVSPFASLDLGMNMYSLDDEDDFENVKVDKSKFYISPAVGLSFRTGSNSYIKVKLGYDFCSKLKFEESWSNSHVTVGYKLGVSAPFIKIGYTHTLNWGADWFK